MKTLPAGGEQGAIDTVKKLVEQVSVEWDNPFIKQPPVPNFVEAVPTENAVRIERFDFERPVRANLGPQRTNSPLVFSALAT